MTLDDFIDTIENQGGKPASEEALVAFETKIGSALPE